MALQRPLTRKEFIIQSLLSSREPWATLVDAEEADPTVPMDRPEPNDHPLGRVRPEVRGRVAGGARVAAQGDVKVIDVAK